MKELLLPKTKKQITKDFLWRTENGNKFLGVSIILGIIFFGFAAMFIGASLQVEGGFVVLLFLFPIGYPIVKYLKKLYRVCYDAEFQNLNANMFFV